MGYPPKVICYPQPIGVVVFIPVFPANRQRDLTNSCMRIPHGTLRPRIYPRQKEDKYDEIYLTSRRLLDAINCSHDLPTPLLKLLRGVIEIPAVTPEAQIELVCQLPFLFHHYKLLTVRYRHVRLLPETKYP